MTTSDRIPFKDPARESLDLTLACSSGGPSLMELAAYVDQRVDEARRQSIQRHLSQCVVCREAVDDGLAARGDEVGPMVFVPHEALSRAMALRAPSAFGVGRWVVYVRRAAAAAAAIGICLIGHSVGAAMSASNAEPAEALNAAMSFGLVDPVDDDSMSDFDLLTMTETSS